MRKPFWPKLMYENMQRCLEVPFEYGVQDCCLFAAKHIDAITGSRWVDRLRSEYHDQASAQAFMARHGGIKQAVTAMLGREAAPAEWAILGDIVLVDGELGPAVGVLFADEVEILIAGPRGLDHLPKTAALCSWRVN